MAASFDDAQSQADELLRGAIATLNVKPNTPGFQRTDLGPVRRELDRSRNSRDNVAATIDRESANLASATTSEKAAIDAKAQADGDLARANQERAQREADVYNYFSSLFGVNLDPSAEIAQVAKRLRETSAQADEKLAQIQEMQSVGMLDNPLDWLVNQIQLPSYIEPYNALATQENSLQATLDNSIRSAQDAAAFNAKGIPAITAAQAKAQADAALAIATKQKADADQELSKQNVSYAIQKLSNDISLATQTSNMTQMEMQQRQQEYQAAINAINLADTHVNRQLKAVELIEKLQKTKGLDLLLENYDRLTGHPKGTTTRFVWERMGENQRANAIAIGAGSFGADPYTAMVNLAIARPGAGLSQETGLLWNYLQERSQEIGTSNKVQMLDEKQKPLAIAKKLTEQIQIDVAGAAKPGSLFYEVSPAKMIAAAKFAPDSKIAKVLEPFTTMNGPIPTNVIVQAIRQEWKNPVEAGQVLADYYKTNIQFRNNLMNAEAFNIKLPLEYKVAYRKSFSLGKTAYDLTKPAEATKYIVMMDAENKSKELVKEGMTMGGGRY